MGNNTLLRRLLIDEEGLDLKRHLVKGLPHIGIGHNMAIDQTDEELAVLGVDDPDEVQEITEAQAYELFDLDVEDAADDLYPAFTDEELGALDETRYAVIISMAFQLGGGGLRKFKNFIAAVKQEDWDTAADEMIYANAATKRESAWHRQTPARCDRAAFAMRNGYFEAYQETTPDNSIISEVPDVAVGLLEDAELIEELSKRLLSKKL